MRHRVRSECLRPGIRLAASGSVAWCARSVMPLGSWSDHGAAPKSRAQAPGGTDVHSQVTISARQRARVRPASQRPPTGVPGPTFSCRSSRRNRASGLRRHPSLLARIRNTASTHLCVFSTARSTSSSGCRPARSASRRTTSDLRRGRFARLARAAPVGEPRRVLPDLGKSWNWRPLAARPAEHG
jgi:hypothetical protein